MRELRINRASIVEYCLLGSFLTLGLSGCVPKSVTGQSSGAHLYVASGACYSGTGNTTFSNTTSSNLVYRIDTSTGIRDMLVADYKATPSNSGDSPVGLADIDANNLYILVENTTTSTLRRIEKVAKADHGARSIFSNNVTALSTQVRYMQTTSTGDLYVAKGGGIEYITGSNVRVGAPFINPSGGTCASSNTADYKFALLTPNLLAFLSAGTTPYNRAGTLLLSTSTANCPTSGVTTAPVTTTYPSAMFYDAANTKLIVAYSGSAVTTGINSIHAYTINATSGAISSDQTIYDAASYPGTYPYLLYGISEMVYDSANKLVYVATAINTNTTVTNYAIEKFVYDPTQIGVANTKVLTRVGNSPWYPYGSDTNCISQMMLSN